MPSLPARADPVTLAEGFEARPSAPKTDLGSYRNGLKLRECRAIGGCPITSGTPDAVRFLGKVPLLERKAKAGSRRTQVALPIAVKEAADCGAIHSCRLLSRACSQGSSGGDCMRVRAAFLGGDFLSHTAI